MNPTKGRIPSLDGLRAFSVLLVLLGHAAHTIPAGWKTEVAAPFLFVFGNARLGVTVFFVISGYLITTLLRRERERTGRISLREFYKRRALRIFPAFYVYIGAIALLTAVGALSVRGSDIGWASVYLWNYKHVFGATGHPQTWFLGHTWSLAIEEQFYLLWPMTLVAVGLLRARWVAAAIVVLTPFVRVATYVAWPEGRDQIGIMLHTAVDPIMVGCLAGLCAGAPWFERLARWCERGAVAGAAAVTALVVSPWLRAQYGGVYGSTVGLTIEAVCILAVMVWATRRPETAVGRALNSRVAVTMGLLSYSVYLWQPLFLTTMNETILGRFPINLAASVAAAALSYTLVERPFLKLKDRSRRAGRERLPVAGEPAPLPVRQPPAPETA